MTVVAENQGKLNCFPLQFRHMSPGAKTVPGKKLKTIFKRVLDASEDNSCESTINILDFGSFERNVPLKESMPAKSKKRRLEISGPGEKKQNDLWKATLPVRPCGLMLQKEKQKRREVKAILSAKVGKIEPGKQAVNAAAGECSSLSEAGELSFNVQMSPKKALRVAMLKKRFADTIFKATHQEHLDHSVQSDRLRLQQERERLQQERREENAKLEALLKAAEEAFRREQQHNLMMQLENERKAARILFDKWRWMITWYVEQLEDDRL